MKKLTNQRQKLPNGKWQHIKWHSQTINIDIDTAELLTKQQIQDGNYIKIATEHLPWVSEYKPEGIIQHINHYKRGIQINLW